MIRVARSLAILCAVLCLPGPQVAHALDAPDHPLKVAFFGFRLIDTSPEPPTDAERARLGLLDEDLRHRLEQSGRYVFVPISPSLRQKIAAAPEIGDCNGCQIDWAREAGADLAVYGMVQKVSNLILNLNLSMDEAAGGSPYFFHSVDIRGNTDDSWQHGISYLTRHYVLGEP